jgi:uncharacterized protein YigE (DUF2233 family)
MKKRIIIFISILIVAGITSIFFIKKKVYDENNFLHYQINPKKTPLSFFWLDSNATPLKSIANVKAQVEKNGNQLLFAMNAGMYKKDYSPQGLFMDNFLTQSPIDTSNGKGNFYLKPNGIFYITEEGFPVVCTTEKFNFTTRVKYATQSGPMLIINENLHPAFMKGSTNLNIRNGVGVLPNGNIIFAMSKKEINFYDFAMFFKNKGCKNALYLDGFVSRMYLPEKKWVQTDGDFGVIIAVVK